MKNLSNFLKYFDFLLTKRYNYLVGSDFSLADIAISTQISSLDYIGNIIEWNKYSKLKDWYSTIKHKPAFQSILEDKITLFEPQKNYNNLNF